MDNDFWIDLDESKESHVIASYFIETSLEPSYAVVKIAKEQSLSNWAGDPKGKKEIIRKYAAKGVLDSIKIIDTTRVPTLATYVQIPQNKYFQFKAKIAYPISNFGNMISTMCNTVIGEIHNIGILTAIRILDIEFPQLYLSNFSGPFFGVDGIRNILGEYKSPIFVGPVKPCVGLTPDQFAKTGYDVLIGGFHIIKDDELMVETSYSRFVERILKTVKMVRKAESKTGQKKMYFSNIGGDSDKIDQYLKAALNAEVDGVMVSPAINGLDIIKRYRGKLPILSHNSFSYASSRHNRFGIKYSLWAKLQRIIGADGILNPCKIGSFDIMDEQEHLENINACLGKLYNYKTSFPALSGGQCPASLEIHYRNLKTSDFMLVVGAAAYGHPMGGKAGAKSFVQAWDAIVNNIKLSEYSKKNKELRISLKSNKL